MNIYVAMPVTQEHINTLKASCPEGNFEFARVLNGADERSAKDPFELDREMIKSADVVVGNIPVDILPECTRLKLLQLNMAGSDAYAGKLPAGANQNCTADIDVNTDIFAPEPADSPETQVTEEPANPETTTEGAKIHKRGFWKRCVQGFTEGVKKITEE